MNGGLDSVGAVAQELAQVYRQAWPDRKPSPVRLG